MEDSQIVNLYWERSQQAIEETERKYGSYCYAIAHNILGQHEDSIECVNDTYLGAWQSIPPHKPSVLSVFLGKITRRTAIDRWRKVNAQKRGSGQLALALEELQECIVDGHNPAQPVEQKLLTTCINAFVASLPDTEQRVFLCRYWYMDSIESIGKQFGFSQSKVKSMLYRIRQKLRLKLEQEDLL